MPTSLTDSNAKRINDATFITADDLTSVMHNLTEEQRSQLSLPEVEEAVSIIAKMVPAGNVPGLIASGLARLRGKKLTNTDVRRDVNLLMHGMHQMFDHAVYNVFFETPARILWGYQHLRKLTGTAPEDAFPEGTWQFYAEYALREDTARHANETHGFATTLRDENIVLSDADRASAWIMAAIDTLHWYPRLLENEWRERVYIRELQALHDDEAHVQKFADVYKQWLAVLPYRLGNDLKPNEDYPAYRRRKFDNWIFAITDEMGRRDKQTWLKRIQVHKKDKLDAYIEQMSIRSTLQPEQYNETRVPKPLHNLYIAIIKDDHYYMLPISQDGTTTPVTQAFVRESMHVLYKNPATSSPLSLASLAQVKRNQWDDINKSLSATARDELALLALCPIVINLNLQERRLPLVQIRQSERGLGNHALTIFDAGETMVFDQSHIYFDGTWGVALAEIMTNMASQWAQTIADTPFTQSKQVKRPYTLRVNFSQASTKKVAGLPTVTDEATAENIHVDVAQVANLRKLFKQRSKNLRLTVNDLLVLYRAIHALMYHAPDLLREEVGDLQRKKATREVADIALEALKAREIPPAILIPVDASRREPFERVHPMTFTVPLLELHLLERHYNVMQALRAHERGQTGGSDFVKLQQEYLASLAGFGQVMAHAKNIATQGETASVGSIKLLAHLPNNLQHFLNGIPGRFEMLNDIIKGREVFSNVGRVSDESTLTRFITAKDDNEQKSLAWGVLTDADDTMVVTLRDFRPHVVALSQVGRRDIAERITQHYLNTYVDGFNTFVGDLYRITDAS